MRTNPSRKNPDPVGLSRLHVFVHSCGFCEEPIHTPIRVIHFFVKSVSRRCLIMQRSEKRGKIARSGENVAAGILSAARG